VEVGRERILSTDRPMIDSDGANSSRPSETSVTKHHIMAFSHGSRAAEASADDDEAARSRVALSHTIGRRGRAHTAHD
jgi:hypothetical protein